MNPWKRSWPVAALVLILLTSGVVAAAADPPINLSGARPPIRVACIGDSITQGVGADGGWAWPDQLDRMLDDTWDVRNYGKSYSQALKSARRPYWNWPEFAKSKTFCADVVVIVLGTNDAQAIQEGASEEFHRDYKALVLEYCRLPSKPHVFCCTPPWAVGREAGYRQTAAIIQRVAKELGCRVIDLTTPLAGKKEWLPDGLHPNTAGASVIAATVYQAVTGKAWDGQVPGPRQARKEKTPIVAKENPGELGYGEVLGTVLAVCRLSDQQRARLGEKYEATATELDAAIGELEARREMAEQLRMTYKHSDPKLYGKYKGMAKTLSEDIERTKRQARDALVALVPDDQRGPSGAAWLNRYVLDRLSPILRTVTIEQRQRIKAICSEHGAEYGRINNTPERSVASVEAYKIVHQQVLTPEQRRRVEPK